MVRVTRTRSSIKPGVALLAVVFAMACIAGLSFGKDEQKVKLSFAFPQVEILKYKASNQTDVVYSGVDMIMSMSVEVEASCDSMTEDGNSMVNLAFSNIKSSLVRDDEIMDWEFPIKLDGKTVLLTINRKGEIVDTRTGSHIPGVSSNEELGELLEDFFVELPDSEVTVGTSWGEDIFEKGKEGEPPKMKGRVEYKLKKIEKKKGIETALIEWKVEAVTYVRTANARVESEFEGNGKANVALEGGYVIDLKWQVDDKKKIFEEDPLTGQEREMEAAETHYYEMKLEK
ncbi:MAG: hypothetical protein JSV33_05165 [bacterium]|nr:MAG: hypothetical protein JSV33_05165 [bacterium]